MQEYNWIFKAESVLDLLTYREASAGITYITAKYLIIRSVSALVLLCCTIYLICNPYLAIAFLPALALYLAITLIQHFRNKNGGKNYQTLLADSGGKPPHRIYLYCEDGIISINRFKNTETHFGYNQITQIIDTGRILILKLDVNSVMIADPRWLSGGDLDSLRSFLESRCANVKTGIQSALPGKRIFTAAEWIAAGFAILIVILSIFQFISPGLSTPGTISENLTVRELAAEMEEMGIYCSDDDIAEIEQWETEFAEENYLPSSSKDRVLGLLCNAGYGKYDFDTWEWTPPESGVYWIDLEAFDIERMYTQHLIGIAALSGGELVFANIQETHDNVDWESGTGEIAFSFNLNGSDYSLTIPMMYDWYDTNTLDAIHQIINSHSTGNRVYAASDSGQGILLFYRTPKWASEFNRMTGIMLFEHLSDLWNTWPY